MRPVDPAPGMSDQVTPDSEAPSSEKPAGSKATPASAPYRVLARKYRPASFDALIGQEALVRTLTNAIDSGRLAQAWMLTGVRGVGKTTTARLIARALNCVGADGKGGVTITPCGVCEHCKAIAEDRHVDVLEMDAASRTGVGDIREILDGVRYRPAVARTKVYIIDEVHMLSTAAFNALLKTLEEPPEHVKFIFATTEIRKVPVTVLSRCQRFDLRRVSAAELSGHFLRIAGLEGAEIAPSALTLIARAADGSVRDGLSLLDQAIAHGGGTVSEAQVAEMLGLADRARIFDLLDALLAGRIAESLDLLDRQYALGADPLVIVQDLLDLVHWMTRVKVVPVSAEDAAVPEAERTRGRAMAERLSMAVLNRCWQILLKGLGEARGAPVPLQAVEMVLIRLAYASDLPTPEEALKMIAGGAQPA
ncbi:DNA polymerase III subunit gamma/tau, partial [Rhodospirillum rubrum]